MEALIEKIGYCIERGKVNEKAPYPPDLKGQIGADEYTRLAVEQGLKPDDILSACNDGMERVGAKFSRNEVFVPELLMSAKAMNAVMAHLKPFFQSGTVKKKGTFVLGTVAGDLHDIGKNLVSMVVAGNGWEVVDLGVDVKPQRFVDAAREHPGCIVGLSALLTTTMPNMANTLSLIKKEIPGQRVIVGGAPLNSSHAEQMGADGYGADPQGAVKLLMALNA